MTYPTSGNPNVTPAPSIHTLPATVGSQQGPAIAKQLEASAEFILEGFIGQVLIAFGGITIAGVKPFAALAALGQALVQKANDAYTQSQTAQSTADSAQSTASTADTKATTSLGNWTALLSALGVPDIGGLVTFLQSAGGDVEAIVKGLFGIDGGNQATLNTGGANLMKLLGLPDLTSSLFDPITAAEQALQNVFTPAGAITSWTQIPAHLFGSLNTGNASANLLPDGSFDDPTSLDGLGLYDWSSDGRTKPGSAWTVCTGVVRPLEGVAIMTHAGDITNLGTYAKWNGVTASPGNAIVLAVNAYDSTDTLISDPTHRVVAAITAPGANSASYPGADANGWVPLSGSYQAPTGTAYLRMCPEPEAVITAGNVGFDDCVQTLQTGIVDASILKNIENIPQLLPASVAGFAGITDLVGTFQHILDGLGSAYHPTGSVSGIDYTDLFVLAQGQTQNALTALEKAIENTLTLGNRTNKPMSAGVNATSESMFTIGHFSSGGSMTSSSLAAGYAYGQVFRANESAVKGFVEFLAFGSGVTNIFVNVYSIDATSKNRALLWASGDIHTQIPSALGYVRALIPSSVQPTVVASDLLQIEIVNAGSAALTIVTKATGVPNHPTDFPANFACTRLTSATAVSPTTLTDAQVTYTGIVPYINFGILDVPADYHAPESFPYTSAGSYALVLPSWLQNGDELDLVGIGGGGGGGGSQFYLSGQGGGAAIWHAMTLVIGTDIAAGSTLNITVGAAGGYGSGFNNGGNGGDTVVTYTKPDGSTGTFTCPGGPYGGPGTSHNGANPNSGSNGQPAANETWDGTTYFGGGTAGAGNPGQSPGGGGGGAIPYSDGQHGGQGTLTVVGSQTI